MTDAEARGWGPGWPTQRYRDMVRVSGGGIVVSVHRLIAPLVAHLLDETTKRGYELRDGQCWGYACRAIAGTRRASNHSRGLAVDLNAPANPMGVGLVTDMPAWMPKLWEQWGFRWGGGYSGRKDAMHYEFTGTPADARSLATYLEHTEPQEEVPMAVVVQRAQGGCMVVQPDGGVFALGGAPFHGSVPGLRPPVKIAGDVVGGAWTTSGEGYWLVDRTGAVYAFGDAKWLGGFNQESATTRGGRVAVGIVRTAQGYQVITQDPSRDETPFDAYGYPRG